MSASLFTCSPSSARWCPHHHAAASPFSTSKVSSTVSSVVCLAFALVGDSTCTSSGIARPRVYHSGTSTCAARRRMSGAVAQLVLLSVCCSLMKLEAGLLYCQEQQCVKCRWIGVCNWVERPASCAGRQPNQRGPSHHILLCTSAQAGCAQEAAAS